MNKTAIPPISFGVDYYPEHWPKERWAKDIRLMKEMGIQAVRMGEFSWSRFEPEPGVYQFGWLDEIIEMLKQAGIYTILGTPTAAPPAWLIGEDPEILPMDSRGERKGFGGRHHDCMSNHHYRSAIRLLVERMAGQYKDEPWVIGWQIDNELGNSHEDLCMCPSCERSFQRWLKVKYKNVSELNAAWGTVFWSQEYNDFSQIPAPRTVPTMHSPSLELDWKRFTSDLVNDFLKMQADIIREISPDKMITHNLMGFYDKTDYFEMAENLDIAGNDQYPTGYYFEQPGQPAWEVAACYDFIRSVKKQPFWMLEMQAGATGGKLIGRTPQPGQLNLWTSQSVAHGADAIVYFRWRNCLYGTEQYWHGILPHSGVPGRTYRELQETIRTLKPVMEEMKGSMPVRQAAILFSYEQDWALQVQPHHPDYSYLYQVQQFYRWCYEAGIAVDFIREGEPMEMYPLVFAPLQYLSSPEQAERLERYVESGGNLVMSVRSGVKDRCNACLPGILPGPFRKLLGITVPEYDCMWAEESGLAAAPRAGDKQENRKEQDRESREGSVGKGAIWCDCICPEGAEPVLLYETGMYKGKPAVTVHTYGSGKAWYIGCVPDEAAGEWIMKQVGRECGFMLRNTWGGPVEYAVRQNDREAFLFVMNHSGREQTADIPEEWGAQRQCCLQPYEVKIWKRCRDHE